MSYDLAVWEGEWPADDQTAGEIHNALYEQYIAVGEMTPPTPRIAAFVGALLERWPDTGSAFEDSPWVSSPFIENASGPYIYFGLRASMADEAAEHIVQVAAEHGLICFDVQHDGLRHP